MSGRPIDDYIQYRIERAYESVEEAEILFASGHYATTVNRLYYASFYVVFALLLKQGHNTKTHTGVKSLFNQHFGATGIVSKKLVRFYNEVFQKRHKGDYEERPVFDPEDIAQLLSTTKIFLIEIEKLI
ncbi:MAG: HEPN domain-containing protein [Tunicatimonas sp.]